MFGTVFIFKFVKGKRQMPTSHRWASGFPETGITLIFLLVMAEECERERKGRWCYRLEPN